MIVDGNPYLCGWRRGLIVSVLVVLAACVTHFLTGGV